MLFYKMISSVNIYFYETSSCSNSSYFRGKTLVKFNLDLFKFKGIDTVSIRRIFPPISVAKLCTLILMTQNYHRELVSLDLLVIFN